MSENKIYVGQHVILTLDSKINLEDASSLEIRWLKPGSDTPVTGNTATADGNSAVFTLTPTILDTAGTWRFYIYAVISSKTYFGETKKIEVYEIGE